MRLARALLWLLAAGAVLLGGRELAYALAPATPLAAELERRAAPPSFLVVALVAVLAAGALAAGLLWLVTVGIRERYVLDGTGGERPRVRVARVLAAATALWISTCAGFIVLESHLHARAGLGHHGLHCLLGSVHRDAIPILAALSLLAAALVHACALVLAWVRRTVRLLLARRRPVRRRAGAQPPPRERVPLPFTAAAPAARGPPRVLVLAAY